MKEKTAVKKIFIWATILVVVYFAVQVVVGFTVGRDYTDKISADYFSESFTDDNMTVINSDDSVIKVNDVHFEDGTLYVSLTPVSKGEVDIEIIDNTNETIFCDLFYKVSSTMIITNINNGNFTYHRLYFFIIMVFCLLFMVLLWTSFVKSYKKLRYSYISIFTFGFALWETIFVCSLVYTFFMNFDMVNVYSKIRYNAYNFILYTIPIMLLFAVFLSISNISLIKHEGLNKINMLGLGLSVFITLGIVAIIVSDILSPNGYEIGSKIYYSVISVYWAIYALLECFLLGSVLCGVLSARHNPSYDKDYVIILGCKIKPDGTLYPLIKARVDRAIKFCNEQKAKTGVAPMIIVSSGKGTDEVISEAEAMKNYILEQGIDQSQILVENKSTNTKENMQFSYDLMTKENPKVAFSTTNYHVFRSGIISRQQGFEPDGMGAKTKWYFWPNAFVREVVGMLSYSWKLLIIMLIPIALFLVAVQFYF